jgi:lysophospholipase L1-like esterase
MRTVLFVIAVFLCIPVICGAQKKLVIIGSSTSECYSYQPTSLTYNQCYVGRLESYYNQQQPNDTLVERRAKSGYNVYNGMPTGYVYPGADPQGKYIPDPTRNITNALALNPDVIVVNYPSNGYLLSELTVSEIMFAFRTIRNIATQNNVTCYITTTQPRNNPAFNTVDQKKRMAELKDSILLQFGVYAINFWDGLYNPADTTIKTEFDQGDQVHLNASGHQVFFDRVKAKNIFGPTGGPLPATFLKTNARFEKGKGQIQWTTSREINIAAFEVQRSLDGSNYSALGKINAHNNPASVYDYSFEDNQPAKGVNYYRIAVLDLDGKIQYSPILKLVTGSGKLLLNKISNQPNQLVLELQSSETQSLELQIINSTGALVSKLNKRVDAGNTNLAVATAHLSKGIYYLRLFSNKQEPVLVSFLKN